jgi:integrase
VVVVDSGKIIPQKGLCMRGRIYSEQKCPICGGKFEYDDMRRGLFCPKHPDQRASSKFIVRFGRETTKRAKTYLEAERILDGFRWEVDQGTFDLRDYKKDKPLGFDSLAQKWLLFKEKNVKPSSFKNLRSYMIRAIGEWGPMNIKLINYGEIEDFLYAQDLSDKTRANIRSCLHDFWTWLQKRRVIDVHQLPEFPEINFELGWRKIIDIETQRAILDEIYRLSYSINPKIWLGIKWLSIYVAIRPGELLGLKEGEIDIKSGYFIIPKPKEKKPKLVPMIDEDIEILKNLPRGLPNLPFFRHLRGISGVKAGQAFGNKYFYKWWKKACASLGVEGVDLYGGTRHSTVTALRQVATPEEIKNATFHNTNKAFERYFRIKGDDVRDIYLRANNLSKAIHSEQHVNNM